MMEQGNINITISPRIPKAGSRQKPNSGYSRNSALVLVLRWASRGWSSDCMCTHQAIDRLFPGRPVQASYRDSGSKHLSDQWSTYLNKTFLSWAAWAVSTGLAPLTHVSLHAPGVVFCNVHFEHRWWRQRGKELSRMLSTNSPVDAAGRGKRWWNNCCHGWTSTIISIHIRWAFQHRNQK